MAIQNQPSEQKNVKLILNQICSRLIFPLNTINNAPLDWLHDLRLLRCIFISIFEHSSEISCEQLHPPLFTSVVTKLFDSTTLVD